MSSPDPNRTQPTLLPNQLALGMQIQSNFGRRHADDHTRMGGSEPQSFAFHCEIHNFGVNFGVAGKATGELRIS